MSCRRSVTDFAHSTGSGSSRTIGVINQPNPELWNAHSEDNILDRPRSIDHPRPARLFPSRP